MSELNLSQKIHLLLTFILGTALAVGSWLSRKIEVQAQSIDQGHLEILAKHEKLRQKARERLADTTQEIEEASNRISQGHLDAIEKQLQIRRNFEKKFMEGLKR